MFAQLPLHVGHAGLIGESFSVEVSDEATIID